MSSEELIERFQSIGLSTPKAKEYARNAKTSAAFVEVLDEGKVTSENEKKLSLLYNLAVLAKNDGLDPKHRSLVTKAVVDERLKTNLQIQEAVKYLRTKGDDATEEGMNEVSGVGIEITKDDVRKEILNYIDQNKEDVLARRYAGVPSLLGQAKRFLL